ncbi:MAG: 7-cyano-7-deazaguanine synthase QueC [Bacteroidia bacterium]|nr:7-cyano-7-deazaguanine synthase QueC [Bacteroidia bacterium]
MAIILLSGGQDSTTALLWALHTLKPPIQALTFRYKQRHAVEVECAERICQKLNIPHAFLEVDGLWSKLQVSSALTSPAVAIEVPAQGLPTTFVPGRNLVFLTLAAIWGYGGGDYELVIGVSEVDYSGYPDCREPFLRAAESALAYALDKPVQIHAPFLHRDKAWLWRYAEEMGYRAFIEEETHTCYQGVRVLRHPWGYGCGECPACKLRAQGYKAAFG